MKKRIIFDLDNTIIIWEKHFISALEETIALFNVKVDVKKIDDIIESMETKYKKLSKELLLNEINSSCDLNLNIDFVNTLFEKQGKLAKEDKEVTDTLCYLNKKYELVILSNYYKEVQEKRLIKAGIRHFFKEIYSGEEYLKPEKNAFYNAMGDKKIEECLMIGDKFEVDIKGAIDIGMDVIAVDYFNKIKDNALYPVIRKFSDLKKLL